MNRLIKNLVCCIVILSIAASDLVMAGPEEDPVEINNLSASATAVAVGDSVTLTWGSTGSQCIEQGSGDTYPGSGSHTSNYNQTTTIEIICYAAGRPPSSKASITIEVYGYPVIGSFYTDIPNDGNTIDYNDSVKVTWASSNTSSCTVDGLQKGSSGSYTFSSLKSDRDLKVSCTNPLSQTVAVSKAIKVRPNVNLSVANGYSLTPSYNGSTKVLWSSDYAGNGCTITDSSGTVGASGSKTFYNLTMSKKTVTLSCKSSSNTSSHLAKVEITPKPKIVLNAADTTPIYNGSVTVTRDAWNADGGCTWVDSFPGNQQGDTRSIDPVTANMTLQTRCTSAEGVSKTASIDITVGAQPSGSLSFSPASIQEGGSASLNWDISGSDLCFIQAPNEIRDRLPLNSHNQLDVGNQEYQTGSIAIDNITSPLDVTFNCYNETHQASLAILPSVNVSAVKINHDGSEGQTIVNGGSVEYNQNVRIKWVGKHVDSCSSDDISVSGLQGSVDRRFTESSKMITVSCSNGSNTVSDDQTLYALPKITLSDPAPSSNPVPYGGSTSITRTVQNAAGGCTWVDGYQNNTAGSSRSLTGLTSDVVVEARCTSADGKTKNEQRRINVAPQPTGSFTNAASYHCTMVEPNHSCTSNITWSLQNTSIASVWLTSVNPAQLLSSASPFNQNWTEVGQHTIALREGTSSSGRELDTATVNVSISAGGEMSFTPNVIGKGGSATLDWSGVFDYGLCSVQPSGFNISQFGSLIDTHGRIDVSHPENAKQITITGITNPLSVNFVCQTSTYSAELNIRPNVSVSYDGNQVVDYDSDKVFSWQAEFADHCEFNDGKGGITPGLGTSGQRTVSITQSEQVIKVTCTNDAISNGAATGSDSAKLYAYPKISLSSNPSGTVSYLGSSTVSLVARNASSCRWTDLSEVYLPAQNEQTITTSRTLNGLSNDRMLIAECVSDHNQMKHGHINIDVAAMPAVSITRFEPTTYAPVAGDNITIYWSANHVQSCSGGIYDENDALITGHTFAGNADANNQIINAAYVVSAVDTAFTAKLDCVALDGATNVSATPFTVAKPVMPPPNIELVGLIGPELDLYGSFTACANVDGALNALELDSDTSLGVLDQLYYDITDTSCDYKATVSINQVFAPGSYSLWLKATYDGDKTLTSDPLPVTFVINEPTAQFTTPQQNAVLASGDTQALMLSKTGSAPIHNVKFWYQAINQADTGVYEIAGVEQEVEGRYRAVFDSNALSIGQYRIWASFDYGPDDAAFDYLMLKSISQDLNISIAVPSRAVAVITSPADESSVAFGATMPVIAQLENLDHTPNRVEVWFRYHEHEYDTQAGGLMHDSGDGQYFFEVPIDVMGGPWYIKTVAFYDVDGVEQAYDSDEIEVTVDGGLAFINVVDDAVLVADDNDWISLSVRIPKLTGSQSINSLVLQYRASVEEGAAQNAWQELKVLSGNEFAEGEPTRFDFHVQVAGGQYDFLAQASYNDASSAQAQVNRITVDAKAKPMCLEVNHPENCLDASLPINPVDNGVIGETAIPVIPGNLSVGQNGTANYSVGIDVPPGINGHQPSLSLSYNHQGGNGIVGKGWSINGLSAITRCNRNWVQDGKLAGTLDRHDYALCLDGNRLVKADNWSSSHKQYRTANESFIKVIGIGGNDKNPDHFVVYHKDGSQATYGNSGDSRWAGEGRQDAFSWRIKTVSDLFADNKMTYYYENNPATGAFRIESIEYGDAQARNQIHFNYQQRDDDRTIYTSGVKRVLNLRLFRIIMFVNDERVRSYILGYESDAVDPAKISHLNSLQKCQGSSACQQTKFVWTEEVAANYESWKPGASGTYWGPATPGVHDELVDVNRDGLVDLVRKQFMYYDNQSKITRIYIAAKDPDTGEISYPTQWDVPPTPKHTHSTNNITRDQYFYTQLRDMNGDGYPDLVSLLEHVYNGPEGQWDSAFLTRGLYVAFNNQQGFTTRDGEDAYFLRSSEDLFGLNDFIERSRTINLLDRDSDGYVDVIQSGVDWITAFLTTRHGEYTSLYGTEDTGCNIDNMEPTRDAKGDVTGFTCQGIGGQTPYAMRYVADSNFLRPHSESQVVALGNPLDTTTNIGDLGSLPVGLSGHLTDIDTVNITELPIREAEYNLAAGTLIRSHQSVEPIGSGDVGASNRGWFHNGTSLYAKHESYIDMDRDGYVDIRKEGAAAVAEPSSGIIQVTYLNSGARQGRHDEHWASEIYVDNNPDNPRCRHHYSGDVNGDGYPDVVADCNPGFEVLINTGEKGEYAPQWRVASAESQGYKHFYDPMLAGHKATVQLMDLNNDGLDDIVYWKPWTWEDPGNYHSVVWVHFSNGNGFEPARQWTGGMLMAYHATKTMRAHEISTTPRIADFDGDGMIDFASHHAYSNANDNVSWPFEVWLNPVEHRYVEKIQQLIGTDQYIETVIDYINISGDYANGGGVGNYQTDYTLNTDLTANAWIAPQINIPHAKIVVEAIHRDNGLIVNGQPQKNTSTYKYKNLRTHRLHGSLGFAQIETSDHRGFKSVIDYSQDYVRSLVGAELRTRRYAPSGELISDHQNQWALQCLNGLFAECFRDDDALFEYKYSGEVKVPVMRSFIKESNQYQWSIHRNGDSNGAYELISATRTIKGDSNATNCIQHAGENSTIYESWFVEDTSKSAFDIYGNATGGKTIVCDMIHADTKLITTTRNRYKHIDRKDYYVVNLMEENYVEATANGLGVAVNDVDQNHKEVFDYYAAGEGFPEGALRSNTTEDESSLWLKTTLRYDHYGRITESKEEWADNGEGNGGMPVTSRTSNVAYGYETDGDGHRRLQVVTTHPNPQHISAKRYDLIDGQEVLDMTTTGVITTNQYDDYGRLTTSVLMDKKGNHPIFTNINYRLCGQCPPDSSVYRVHSKTDGQAAGDVYYDLLGRKVGTRSIDQNGASIYTQTLYDRHGQVVAEYVPNKGSIGSLASTYLYDEFGRVLTLTNPDNSYKENHYKGLVAVKFNERSTGNVPERLQQVEPGRQTETVNGFGWLVEVKDHYDTKITYQYDARKLLRETETVGLDGKRTYSSIFYDERGNRVKLIDPNTGEWNYKHNALGLIYEQLDAAGNRQESNYDVLGRIQSRIDHAAVGYKGSDAQFHYDEGGFTGLLTRVTGNSTDLNEDSPVPVDQLTPVSRGYEKVLRYNDYGLLVETIENDFSIVQFYDRFNRNIGTAYPVINFNNQPQRLVVRTDYNQYGYPKTITNPIDGLHYWTAGSTDERGQLTEFTYGNGVTTTQTYNPATGRLERSALSRPEAPDFLIQGFKYDELGNLIQRSQDLSIED